MKTGIRLLAVFVLGAACAVAAALLPMKAGLGLKIGSVSNGPWNYSNWTGSTRANPWIRAWVALHGTWALGPEEALYTEASADSSGAPLRTSCKYRVRGNPVDARWWSLTLYKDNHLVENSENRYSWSASTLEFMPDGSWEIVLAREAVEGNWLPMGQGEGDLSLILRFYNPSQALMASGLGGVQLPRIEREHCK